MIRRLRLWLIENFGFSRKESNGFLVMLLFLLLSIGLRITVTFLPDQVALVQDSEKLDSLVALYETVQSVPETHIEVKKQEENISLKQSKAVFDKPSGKTEKDTVFDINKATPSMLQSVYGVGPVLSERICKFRDILGGFYSMDQLVDVYGLEQDVIERCRKKFEVRSPVNIKRLSINKAEFKEILRHPYISYEQTKEIFRVRKDTVLQSFLPLIADSVFTVSDTVRLYSYITF